MYEIEVESKEKKEQHLRKFIKKSNVIHTIVAVLATVLIPIYFYYAIKYSINLISRNFNEYLTDSDKTHMMQWIISSIFTVVIIAVSLTLMW